MIPGRKRAVVVDAHGVAQAGFYLPALIERLCPCGKTFKTRRHVQKFHSRVCAGKRRGGRRKKMVTK